MSDLETTKADEQTNKRTQKAQQKKVEKEDKALKSLKKEKPQAPKVPQQRNLLIILDQVSLETAQTKRGIELLNSDDHTKLLAKTGREPSEVRPDIAHQCLLALLDSPLNKHKKLQVLLRTQKGITIEVHPDIRIPRTFKRFSGLMASLLTKGRIQAAGGGATLLKASKLPIQSFLPQQSNGSTLIRVSKKGTLVPNLAAYVADQFENSSKRLSFILSASPTETTTPQTADQVRPDEEISISNYELSSIVTCSRLCFSLEEVWNVL